ncbi:MAG: Rpp14/Pop5 family protein [Candidatus Bathyarchaeota archaeon]|nr:Rpp14/Pop5 family protein [Candidatus Bathyarchaeota archaeon]
MRRRYLALKIDSDETFSSKDFMDAVWSAISKLYGEYGASQTGLALIDYDVEKGFAVLRTSHTAVKMVRIALASITKIGIKPATIHVLTVSGTIKALHKKLENSVYRKLI